MEYIKAKKGVSDDLVLEMTGLSKGNYIVFL